MLVSSHWSDNASSVTDRIGEGEDGNMALLDVCGGGAVRLCIFKDGLRIGVAEMVLGGTMSVFEFSLTPLSSPSDVPNSFTVVVRCPVFEGARGPPENCVLAIVIPAQLLSPVVDKAPFPFELSVLDRG